MFSHVFTKASLKTAPSAGYGACLRALGHLDDWHTAMNLLQEMQFVAILPNLLVLTAALGATLWRHGLDLLTWTCLERSEKLIWNT